MAAIMKPLLYTLFASVACGVQVAAQTAAGATLSTPRITNSTSVTPTVTSSTATASAPDVYLNVPTLSVGRIELDVDNLSARAALTVCLPLADINLNANVAKLVTINAGVQVGITKVNLTIADVDAQLELIVRLGHLADIVERVFQSLDLNPLLINTLNGVTAALDNVVGEVDGLLGSITQGGTTLSFLVDNLGNIVQQVGVDQMARDRWTCSAFSVHSTGTSQSVGNGLTQKTYSYSALGSLVNIVFNSAGQIVQAAVAKATGSGSSGGSGIVSNSTQSATAAVSSVLARN
ncbi:hypothetical protein LTS09_002352 [Friedmanniomyces endolithicus]|nr:hypothetical protein LTS09_002352 [Friedmanniomyces endolithicus]